MNRLDSPRLKPFINNPAFSNVSRHSSARDMLDTQEALEDMKKTMTADFSYSSGSGQVRFRPSIVQISKSESKNCNLRRSLQQNGFIKK